MIATNKKGISDVVSTVLIILLVVAAVAIIGVIVLNTVGKTSNRVSDSVACQQIQLVPQSCSLGAGTNLQVRVNRADGAKDSQIAGIDFVFTSASNGQSSIAKQSWTLSPLETKLFDNINAPGGPFSSVRVAAIITGNDGSEVICDPSVKVDCK